MEIGLLQVTVLIPDLHNMVGWGESGNHVQLCCMQFVHLGWARQ